MLDIRVLHVIMVTMIVCAVCVQGAGAASTASVQVAVNLPLQDVKAALEAAIPAKIERLGATEFDGGWGFRYGAWRGPISVSGDGGALRIGTRIQFAVWVCKQVPRPWPLHGAFCQPFASCGYGNDPLAAVDVWTTVTGSWTPDWSVAASVATGAATIQPCRMTILNIDVTQRAIGLLRSRIEAEASKLRERMQLRPEAERAWGRIKPLSLGNDVWIVWRAESIRVGPIAFQPFAITSDAAIDLSASVVTSSARPTLPALPSSLTVGATSVGPPGWKLQVAAAWTDISSVLTSKFGAYAAGSNVHIALVRVSAVNGRVQLELEVSGAVSASITASAAVTYDAAADVLAVADIKLVGVSPDVSARVDGSALAAAIEARLKWPLAPLVASPLAAIDQALTNQGLEHPSLAGLHPDTVLVTPTQLIADISVARSLAISP